MIKEFDAINRFFKRSSQDASIVKSVGDDCAILSVPTGYQLVMSLDTLVEGRHFPCGAAARDIATRTFCTSLSDLAAMGAEPKWFTMGLTLPSLGESWLGGFSESLFAIADEFGCELIGGDTTQGPMTISIQVHGFVPQGQGLLRSGAKVGDEVWVTGTLGDGKAGLEVVTEKIDSISSSDHEFLKARFYRPLPQIAAGRLLVDKASAAIDISDGLLADLQHIAASSQVDIQLDADAIPVSVPTRNLAGEQSLLYALTGGDDYQLAFTIAADQVQSMQQAFEQAKLTVTKIGTVTTVMGEVPVVTCYKNKTPLTFEQLGYQHFAS